MEEIEKKPHFFRTLFFIIILLIILLIVYGKFLGNSGLIVKQYDIKNKDLAESFNNLKIAHFSDIFYSNKEDIDLIDEIITKINDKKVDIIIFSGNLTNGKYNFNEEETNKLIQKLSLLNSTYGKYFVSGENDKDNPSYEAIMTSSGFNSLNDNKDVIYSKTKDKLLLVGKDYNSPGTNIPEILKEENVNYKIITFSESDDIDELKDYNFNLALASNSLNGQINIPIAKEFFLREGSKKYYNNYYKINDTDFYVNSGIGTDKIDFRLFNRPCINVYVLNKNM